MMIPDRSRFGKYQCYQSGNVVIDVGMLLWHRAMHISGALELEDLNGLSEPGPLGAARAWHAEVSAASWSDRTQLLGRFPSAQMDGDHVLFDLGEGDHCVIARFNYEMQSVLMKYFGTRASAVWPPTARGRKAKKKS